MERMAEKEMEVANNTAGHNSVFVMNVPTGEGKWHGGPKKNSSDKSGESVGMFLHDSKYAFKNLDLLKDMCGDGVRDILGVKLGQNEKSYDSELLWCPSERHGGSACSKLLITLSTCLDIFLNIYIDTHTQTEEHSCCTEPWGSKNDLISYFRLKIL